MEPLAFVAWRGGDRLPGRRSLRRGGGSPAAASRLVRLRGPRRPCPAQPRDRRLHGLHAQPVHVHRVRPDHGRARAARLLHVSGHGGDRQRRARSRAARPATRASRSRSPSPGWSRSSPRSSTHPRASGSTWSASRLALGAAASQAVFVLVSRKGYRTVPADQAMAVVLGVTRHVLRVLDRGHRRGRDAGAAARVAVGPAAAPVHRAVRGGDPVDAVPHRHPTHRGNDGRHPDAVRAGGRRGARGLAPGRGPRADPGPRRPGDPGRGADPPARDGRRPVLSAPAVRPRAASPSDVASRYEAEMPGAA